mgnify:CR=1 FL=1
MQMTSEAREQLSELLDDAGDDMFALVEEYPNHGICYKCGNLQSGVEPDAEGYECDECGARAVGGLEMAMVELI